MNISARLKCFLKESSMEQKDKSRLSAWFSYRVQLAKLFVSGLKAGFGKRKLPLLQEQFVDVLFIHEVELMQKLDRKRGIFARLKDAGLTFTEIDSKGTKEIAGSGEFYGTSEEGLMFRYMDLYAQYVLESYRPKVIVTDRNGDLFSPFLKKVAAAKGCKIVHLPHSVITLESSKYRMMDYDYYLLYGLSSLECLQQIRPLFGTCQALLAGSYLFDRDFSLPAADSNGAILLLGMGPAMEERPVYAQYYEAVVDWLRRNPEVQLHVRLHPRSPGDYWRNVAKTMNNVTLRPQGEGFVEACRSAYMCITSYTNAVVDAALLGRPSLLICGDDVTDYLQVERFFGNRVADPRDISEAVDHYRVELDTFQRKAEEFARYHVHQGCRSVEYISNTIVELAAGVEPKEAHRLTGSH